MKHCGFKASASILKELKNEKCFWIFQFGTCNFFEKLGLKGFVLNLHPH
jgi:hypothetical protein